MTLTLLLGLIAAAVAGLMLAVFFARARWRRAPVAIVIAIALPALVVAGLALYADPPVQDADPETAGQPAGATTGALAGRDELVRHLARHARDGRAWVLLARLDFEADRFDDAVAAYRNALAASPKVAADPGVWCEYADALGMAQGGTLAGKPGELVAHALALNAAHPKALDMAGSAAYEQGDFATAARHWRTLLALLPAGSPRHRELAAALARTEHSLLAAGAPAAAAQ